MDFTDQVVFITGASKGIGKRLALDFAKRGATVLGCARAREPLVETLKEVRQHSPSSLMMACDIGDSEQVRAMMATVLRDYGKVDILINNAGIGMRQPFAETALSTIEAINRTNYLGTVYCTHALLPAMIARRSGHIVNISSGAGKVGALNMAAYCASKFAVNGFSESLYHELKAYNIHVSVVCPGPVRTAFNRGFADLPPKSPPHLVIAPEEVSAQVLKAIEKNRFETILPRWLAFFCWINRLMPATFRWLAGRTMAKT